MPDNILVAFCIGLREGELVSRSGPSRAREMRIGGRRGNDRAWLCNVNGDGGDARDTWMAGCAWGRRGRRPLAVPVARRAGLCHCRVNTVGAS